MTICSYFSDVLKNSLQYFCGDQKKIIENNPEVLRIMGIMKNSDAFNSFLSNNQEINNNIIVHACSREECEQKGIKVAALAYHAGSWLSSAFIDIYFDRSLPLIEQVRGVLIEFCNAAFAHEFNQLDQLAQKGTLDRERFIFFKEKIEWKAAQSAFQIAETIDSVNLFENKTIFTSEGKNTMQDFDRYFQIQQESGHSERYGKMWDKITHKVN